MLSVIVTFYDETAFLRTALRSVFNQSIDALEVIVVNDNPERFSHEDLAGLTRGFDVRVVHHAENGGLSAARNTGMSAANGSHIGFLDADDYFTVGGLKKHFDFARETKADITHAATYLGHEGSVHAALLNRDKILHMQQRVVSGRLAAEEAQFIVSSWSSLYRTDFIEKNDLWFDVEQRKFEDRLFVLHAVTAARKVAFLGDAVRVWRRRANSISSAKTTPVTHLLQVQLLEKCMAHMRSEVQARRLPTRYEKRELFNCVSRLVWDMDIIAPLAAGDPEYSEMGARIQTLLGDDSFGHAIFDDSMVRKTSRVGMNTRKGLITRADFFDLHKRLRDGDFVGAHALMEARKPGRAGAPVLAKAPVVANHRHKRLVLHIGLHKTGSTYVQHHLKHHRKALRRAGVLVPQTGFDDEVSGRPGALSGHQGLVRALRQNDVRPWNALDAEIEQSPARVVVLSAENMSFPTAPDREELIEALFQRLGSFGEIDVVAFARAPHAYVEAFHAEWVASAHASGARSLEEMMVDHGDRLSNLAALFSPFEQGDARRVRLADFDALRQDGGLWQGFCALAGLPVTPADVDVPRYPTPDRASVRLLQLLNTTVSDRSKRQRLMDTYFAHSAGTPDKMRLMPPEAQLGLIEHFAETSAAFAAARGYEPDLAAIRQDIAGTPWEPLDAIPAEHLAALLDVSAQIAGEMALPHQQRPQTRTTDQLGRYEVRVRLRPWVAKTLDVATNWANPKRLASARSWIRRWRF